MNPNEGTFSIWVQAIDWDWSEKVNRWWIDVSGPTRFIVYHYLHSNSIFFYHMDERRKHPTIVKSPMDWQPGEWKHLAASWKDGRLRLYVNGEKVPEEARALRSSWLTLPESACSRPCPSPLCFMRSHAPAMSAAVRQGVARLTHASAGSAPPGWRAGRPR